MGLLGLLVAISIGIFGGLMNKLLGGCDAGVQFMAYCIATLFVRSCWPDVPRGPQAQAGYASCDGHVR